MKKLDPRRLLKKRRNSGFTLVELIISCALLGILIIGVVTFATPVLNMINSEHKSARATGLAETLDSYISGTLRNAIKIQVIQNTSFERIYNPEVVNDSALGLRDIYDFMCEGDNADKYEVRCLGICWITDQSSPYYSSSVSGAAVPKKQMIVNLKLRNVFAPGSDKSGALMPVATSLSPKSDGSMRNGAFKVFDDALYNGLYPVINVETFKAKDSSGSETTANANGYKITANIYSDRKCYSTISQTQRDKSHLAFTGITYTEFINPDPNKDTVIKDITVLNVLQNTIDANKGSRQYIQDGASYYYPDTYFFYVVSKH